MRPGGHSRTWRSPRQQHHTPSLLLFQLREAHRCPLRSRWWGRSESTASPRYRSAPRGKSKVTNRHRGHRGRRDVRLHLTLCQQTEEVGWSCETHLVAKELLEVPRNVRAGHRRPQGDGGLVESPTREDKSVVVVATVALHVFTCVCMCMRVVAVARWVHTGVAERIVTQGMGKGYCTRERAGVRISLTVRVMCVYMAEVWTARTLVSPAGSIGILISLRSQEKRGWEAAPFTATWTRSTAPKDGQVKAPKCTCAEARDHVHSTPAEQAEGACVVQRRQTFWACVWLGAWMRVHLSEHVALGLEAVPGADVLERVEELLVTCA